jgi:hypothetical protein
MHAGRVLYTRVGLVSNIGLLCWGGKRMRKKEAKKLDKKKIEWVKREEKSGDK